MDKAYIVANEKQEREVLNKFELKGYVWFDGGQKPTEWLPSHMKRLVEFPYALLDDGELSWCYTRQLGNAKIVYDGRKESKMKISKEVYDALVEWKERGSVDACKYKDTGWVGSAELLSMPEIVETWWRQYNAIENNNRLIAIIRWVNGEDVFEIEKPKKWVVRSKETDEDGDHWYVSLYDNKLAKHRFREKDATKFDTKEEAESWANAHQEVIEIEVEA